MGPDDNARSALAAIPSDDRDVWVRMAFALKLEYGEAARDLWEEWSRLSEKYRERDAESVWRSVRAAPPSPVTMGSLYYIARQWGWDGRPGRTYGSSATRVRAELEEARRRERALQKEAALVAQELYSRTEREAHPYLERKGFGKLRAPVLDGALCLPMRDQQGRLWNVQRIGPEGTKRYLPGSRAGGLWIALGSRGQEGGSGWVCEGFATGLSLLAALRALGRERDWIAVAFSSTNAPTVARLSGATFVAADRDLRWCWNRECRARWDRPEWEDTERCPECGYERIGRPAGERYARQSGLPYWLPESPGDANDLMVERGLGHLAGSLGRFVEAQRRTQKGEEGL